jgi:hypothetical protein
MIEKIKEYSVPVTFAVGGIYCFLIAAAAAVSPAPEQAVLLVSALTLVSICSLVLIVDAADGRARDFLILALLGVVWFCTPACVLLQESGIASASALTIFAALLFVAATVGLAYRIADAAQLPFTAVALIPMTAISVFLVLGDGRWGYGFLDAVVARGILSTNLLLRVFGGLIVVTWLGLGVLEGLRLHYPRFLAILAPSGLAGRRRVVNEIDSNAAFSLEVLKSIAIALGVSVRRVLNRQASSFSLLLTLSMLSWMSVAVACDWLGNNLQPYFANQEFGVIGVAVFAAVWIALLLSSLTTEAANHFNDGWREHYENSQRVNYLLSTTLTTLFVASAIGHIIYLMVQTQHPTEWMSQRFGGYRAWLGFNFLTVVPILWIAHLIRAKTLGVSLAPPGAP